MDFKSWATDNLLVRVLAGSRLYGTNNAQSDYDYRGVCIDPPSALVGIHRFDQQQHVTKNHDEVIYGASKFMNMCVVANPSILDILFARGNDILFQKPEWSWVTDNAESLLSQKVRYTFSGYAFSQLKRIKRHKAWIDFPPDMPTLEEFGLRLHNTPGGGQVLKLHQDFAHRDESSIIAQYKDAQREFKKYQEWKRNRNPARAVLEEKYGYDVKHAAHLVRLLLQGENILREGTYQPRLVGKTKSVVTDVLRGNWHYQKLVEFAEEQEHKVMEMNSSLRHSPDSEVLHGLLYKYFALSVSSDEKLMELLQKHLAATYFTGGQQNE